MGVTNSKAERSTALKLCIERKKFMKQAIDSRYSLAAAHVSYVQSLKNIGVALRKYAETEILLESSVSASVDKTPSPSSYPSPSGGVSDSPVLNGSPFPTRVSYMRSTSASPLTVKMSPPPKNVYVEDEGEFTMPPPPPPPPEPGASWDYFDPADESFRFVAQNLNFDDARISGVFGKNDVDGINGVHEVKDGFSEEKVNGSMEIKGEKDLVEEKKKSSSVEKEAYGDREDPSEFITHRAKDFVSSIKDIDNRFFRASESGKEVSRMLECSRIHVGYADARGTSSPSNRLASFGASCCQCNGTNVYDDQHATKVITWKRTTSSRSNSSRNPLKDDNNDDSGSDFMEEFCMISGSHSSTLERLYAWERKLYDEVKACESIQKEYDHKCDQLRHQFAKDLSPPVIDKTRAVVKDLYTRIRVALHAVDAISKRIEKIREEELLPQLLEFIQGLTRMWKAMLECHHSQYITISLAYHAKSSAPAPQGETQRLIMNQLQDDVEYFGLSFANWINSYTSYVESLNNWLQNCILQPRERHKGRRAFSPRRYLAPSIFVLCRDWSTGIKSLPSQEVSDGFRIFLSDLRYSVRQQAEDLKKSETADDEQVKEGETNGEGQHGDFGHLNIRCIQESLTKVLDRLTKFSEASVKMCEEIKQKCDLARNAYDNYKAPPRSFSI